MHHHGREDRHSEGDHGDEDGDNEVSINLEDAIATAEEINNRNDSENMHQQIVDGLDDYEDDDMANEIAGIVTDGHNERDGFD